MNNTTTSTHRKRVGRPPGKSCTPQTDTSPNVALNSATAKEDNLVASRAISATGLDGSAEPISLPATDLPSDPIAAAFPVHPGNAECRRSSRKKIVKFDVRDLLNKNRKPHKIQIEARIDSNAPATTSLASTVQHVNSSTNSSLPPISTTAASDLTSKQKTFIEKSAIFRRYSISAEQQNKITSSQRPPLPSVAKLTSNKISMLSQLVSENADDAIAAEVERAKIAQARRLSRTQEIFNASMQKSKQNSSLIIAQMESSSCSSSAKKMQRKTDFAGADVSKRKNTAAASKTTLGGNVTKQFNAISNVREGKEKSSLPTAPAKVPKRRGRPPKNKAKAIANSETAQEISTERIINQGNPEENKSTKTLVSKPTINKALISPEKAKNWQEYKACLKVCQTQSEAKPITTASNVSQSEVILEISSSSSESESESDAMQSPPSNGATKQRNFEAVSFLHEISSSVNDNLTAPEFIVASVEEILTEPITVDSCESANMLQQEPEAADENVTEKPRAEESTIESMKSTSNVSSPKRLGGSSSSSSESETYSERSQNKVYKHGDKLRVSLKRLSTQELSPCKGVKMTPPSPTISACSSSSSSNKSIFSESSMKARKQSTRKRSKRLEQPELHQENPNVSICSENKPTFKHKKEQMATLELSEGNSTELKDVKQKYDDSSIYPVIEENSCEQNDRNQNDLKDIKNSEVEEEEEKIDVKETFLRNVEEVNTNNVDDRELKDEELSVKKEELQEIENKELPEAESTTFISVEKTVESEVLSEEDNGDPDKEISAELYEKYIEEESLQEVKEKSTNERYNDEIKAVENENTTNQNELKGHEEWIGNKDIKEIDQIKGQEEVVVFEEIEECEKDSGAVAITEYKKIYALRETIDPSENESQKLAEDLVEELDEEEIKQQIYADALNVENKDMSEQTINQNGELITEYIEVREDNEISNKIDMEELTEIIIDQEDSKETDNLENNEFAIDENEETKKVREESSAQYEIHDLNQDHAEEQNVVLMQESDFMNVMPSNETDQLDDKIVFSSSIEETLYEEATGSIVIPIVEKEEIVETVTVPFEESAKEPQEAEAIIDTQLCTDSQSYTSPETPNSPKEIRMSNEIRLPPKKQLKKFSDTDDTSPRATSAPPKLHSLVSQLTEQVNVETKTLLDILKTVQSNATAAAAANKSPAGKISPTCDSDSPGRSPSGGSSSPQALVVRKTTTVRRYERRRRGGEEEIFHKTLEETFAEIAAESSKQILEMVTSRNELAEAIEASLADNLKTPSLVEETLEATDKIVLEYETKKETEKEATETAQMETLVAETECKDIADDPNAMIHDNNSQNNTRTKSPQEEIASVSREVVEEPAENTSTDIQPYSTDLKISDNKNEPLAVKTPMKRGRKPKAKVKETMQTVMEINNENIDQSLITHQSENATEEFEKATEEKPTQSQNDVLQFTSDVIFKDVNHEDLNEHSVKSDCNQQANDEIRNAQKTEESLVILDNIKDQNESENQEEIWKIQDVQQDSEKINLSEQILNPVENQKEVGEIELPQLKFVQPKELHNTIENPIKLSGEITENIAENAEIMKETNESKNIDEKPEFIIEEGVKKCELEKLPVEEIIELKQEVVQIGTLQKYPVIPKDTTDAIQSKSIPIAPPKKRFLKAQMDAEYNIVASANKIENHTTTTDANTSKKKARKNTKAISMLKEEVPAVTEKEATPTSTSKRGPKPKQKLTTEAQNSESTVSESSTKKNTKKLIEDIANQQLVESSPKSFEKKIKKLDKKKFLEPENDADGKTITVDEKSAKKKRQKKLKESFEAVLMENSPETEIHTNDNPTDETLANNANKFSAEQTFPSTPNTLSPQSTSPLHHLSLTSFESDQITASAADPSEAMTNITPAFTAIAIEPDEDPDPLKDIEKFIEDGVNLLKRGYKVGDDDDDSVDAAVLNAAKKVIKQDLDRTPLKQDTGQLLQSSDIPSLTSFADTPADTPLATPTATPPPKSPVGPETSPFLLSDVDTYALSGGVRRSHRIKQNSKMPKALVGRGLVREKERFSLKDDVETKTPYTIDDHRMDLAEVDAKNAKFLKDMEERLSNFRVIKENEYKCERVVSKEAKKMICDCFLTADEEERGELACGEDCLNRLLMIECGPDCNIKERCANKRFQKFLCSPCRVFRTEKKGFGLLADIEILSGEFIMEYVGEVINGDEFERRRFEYSLDKNRHYYFMALRSDAIIDATNKGNISRFINHSCDPNAETQKWTVNGELRIGFFSKKSIMPGEEITFDYQYQRYGREAQRCYCESMNCRGWIGEEPNSDEGEQVGEDSECDEEEEENLAERLLADDDEDDSDETEADAEEARKKLEIAAAEAKLLPITEEYKKDILENAEMKKKKSDPDALIDGKRNSPEEDSKSKFKKLLCKMAEKVAKKKKQKKERKKRNRRDDATTGGAIGKLLNSRYLEDPDIEDEVNFLSRCGLKNQSDTLRLSRLVVRAKLVQTRLNLLKILRNGELPCRRLFLDYHGLRLLHGWISEDGGDLDIRLALLETLESLPIANKTMLTDSKVYQAVLSWCSNGAVTGNGGNSLSPSDESSKESTTSQLKPTNPPQQELPTELKNLALKLTATWDSLPEIFRIPKRERIEQMKEHEREADRQYAVTAACDDEARRSSTSNSDRYQRDRFSRNGGSGSSGHRFTWPRGGSGIGGKESRNISVLGTNTDPRRRGTVTENIQQSPSESTKHLSKEERRQMFAAKVARDEAEKRFTEERREFETKCRFFGLDPKRTRPQHLPFCVNPSTGQWYSVDRQPIPTPPSYAHVQVPVRQLSTNPDDYQLPAAALNLSHKWKFAITPQGKIYYYHVEFRVPQWEPPTPVQMYGDNADQVDDGTSTESESDGDANDSTDDNDEVIKGMEPSQLEAFIEEKVENRRQQRYSRLVDERSISPRREEDRIYNQMEVRKYKENKEKIRKRKEEIRRRRLEALKNSTLNMCTLGSPDHVTAGESGEAVQPAKMDTDESVLPIQDYLLSSDEEDIKAECNNSPLIDKIVQGDKIVDELDALTKKALKRPLAPHLELPTGITTDSEAATTTVATSESTVEKHEHHKKRKIDKRESSKSGKKSKDQDSKYRKLKEKFRCEIAGIIVQHLKPYRKEECVVGRIQSNEDFNHLARKLTHFVMIKELKYCESVGQTLVVTESVKNKSREFIKKYMAKYGDVYARPENDPDFKDIPFSL